MNKAYLESYILDRNNTHRHNISHILGNVILEPRAGHFLSLDAGM